MSRASDRSLARARAAENGDQAELDRLEAEDKAEAAKQKKFPSATKPEDKSTARLIMESSLYDNSPTARLILNQLVALAMKEDSRYPKDSPYGDDKVDWCWMAQWELSLRCGLDSDGRTLRYWIARFREEETIFYREWWDEYGTHHAEYKVNREPFLAFQRPDNKEAALASRPGRYAKGSRKANKGSFSKTNQPKMSATRRAILEMDDE